MMRKFNLSLDDFSPHPRAGLNFESIHWCDKLIERYPDIKIDLFIPVRYKRLSDKTAYCLDIGQTEWCQRVQEFVKRANYSVCPHGVNHMREANKKYPASNNDEFQYIDEVTAQAKLGVIYYIFDKVGIKYDKVFRPPGWKLSVSAAKVLTKHDFIIAGNKEYYNILKHRVPGMKWVSYNYDLVGAVPGGDIVSYGHTSNWTNNYFNEQKYHLVCDILDSDEFEFYSLKDLAK